MAFCGIVFLLVTPFLTGALIIKILREKAGIAVTYATGLLSLFAYFFACILLALKLDLKLSGLEHLFIFPILILSLCGIFFVKNIDGKAPRLKAKDLFVAGPTVLLFLYAYIYLSPSVINDDTWDVVSVTLANQTIYTHSAMTGAEMVKGLPIFNKIYIMPMFIACLCDFFKVGTEAVIRYILPLMSFALNLSLVYEISKETKIKNTGSFLLIYMMLLMAGTYLPEKGIPVTVGYSVLREGYSGYAFAYGVLAPLVILLLLKHKKLCAGLACIPLVGLIRLDRIFYALKTPISSVKAINTAGKLIALYLVALVVLLILRLKKIQSISWPLILLPSAMIAYEACEVAEFIENKKEKYFYYIGLSFAIFSACGFFTFLDAVTDTEDYKLAQSATEILGEIEDKDAVLWTDTELCGYLHRADGSLKTLYGRNVGNPYMDGLDYEDQLTDIDTFYRGYYNLIDRNTFFDMDTSVVELLDKLKPLCDYIIYPKDNLNTNIYAQLKAAGYTEFATTDNFKIYSTNR